MASRIKRSVPVTLNDVLDGHVKLDLQCLDLLYLHGYLGRLQVSGQLVQFLKHRGYPIPSAACLQQIGDAFRRRVASFAEANHIPVVPLKAADRNVEVMQPNLDAAARTGRSQVAAIGVAQEPQRVFIARKRDTDPSRCPQFSFDKKDRRVTVYYFYPWDAGFGPGFIKVCTYSPWPVKIWVNGHEWAKQQARRLGLGFTELSNGFAVTLCAVTGITNRSLRALMTGLLGTPYGMTQASYDLARLRRNGLITRRPRANTYDLTTDGLAFAIFYTKVHDRVLAPLFTAEQPQSPPQLRAALNAIEHHIDERLAAARLPAAA